MQPTLTIMHKQRGFSLSTFIFGLVLGVAVGAALAAGVSFYITKTPVPFVERVSQQEQLQVPPGWNPNQSLQHGTTTVVPPPAPLANNSAPSANVASDPTAVAVVGNNTSGMSAGERVAPSTAQTPERRLSDPANNPNTQFYVQAGAFSSASEAEQQRARLALLGSQATVSQVVAAGRTIHRVRIGPYSTREAASIAQNTLAGNNIDATIVLVQPNP